MSAEDKLGGYASGFGSLDASTIAANVTEDFKLLDKNGAIYEKNDLLGKQVMAVVNFPAKQIGPMMSECLVTGFHDASGAVVLVSPDDVVPNGAKLL